MAMQTPAPVEYSRATSVDDAITQMSNLGGNARFLAGGHSLIPMMKLRLADPGHLIDLNPIEPELNYIRHEGDEIRIGAMTRHRDMLESPLLAAALPDLLRGRARPRRPGRPQPRHHGRFDVPGRPG